MGFGEQAHILDRDHGLVGKRLDQFGFAWREGNWPTAGQGERADWLAVAHERHAEHRSNAADASLLLLGVFGVVPCVGNLDGPSLQCDPPDQCPATRPDFRSLLVAEVGGIDIHLAPGVAVDVSVPSEDLTVLGVA